MFKRVNPAPRRLQSGNLWLRNDLRQSPARPEARTEAENPGRSRRRLPANVFAWISLVILLLTTAAAGHAYFSVVEESGSRSTAGSDAMEPTGNSTMLPDLQQLRGTQHQLEAKVEDLRAQNRALLVRLERLQTLAELPPPSAKAH